MKREGDSPHSKASARSESPALTSPTYRPNTRRPAAGVTFVYLLVTLPLALNAARGLTAAGSLALHCLALIGAGWAWRRDSNQRWLPSLLADWLPLLLVAFLYAELPTLMFGLGINAPAGVAYHDLPIQRLEQRMFGGQPSRTLAGALPIPWLSELLHAGYLCYYAIIYLPPLVLYVEGSRKAFDRCQLALMLAFTSCFVAFVLFPVEGPRYLWPPPDGVPDGPVRRAVLWILEGGSSRGTAFPSSHAAVSVAQSVMLWRVQARWLRVPVSATAALLLVGAVYGGFHYAVDMSAGAIVGVLAAFAATAAARRRA